jgi:selenocysteine-specific elongation factor
MHRDLILGTAGHIDHGKTALIRALTGIDCDRLPEEKARGITIDIGFARLTLDGFDLGIVDVPGHERFIRNMLAGAAGVDLALLTVAADDSVMPQTREHLELLQILRVQHGLIAITKCDLVAAERLERVEAEVRELVRGTFLADAPIIRTSVVTGQGLDELRAAIATVCQRVGPRPVGEWFRLWVDRVFVVQGHGTVVTGTVESGSVGVGESLALLPGGGVYRVRGLHRHDQPVGRVSRGMRAAINLAGLPREAVYRGCMLATPDLVTASTVLCVELTAYAPLRHRVPVHVHVGTAEVLAVLALLDAPELRPRALGLAQLLCQDPLAAVWDDPLVVRDSSDQRTLGGGRVLHTGLGPLRRRHTQTVQLLRRLGQADPVERVAALAGLAGSAGISANECVARAGANPSEVTGLLERLRASGRVLPLTVAGRTAWFDPQTIYSLEERILQLLTEAHAQSPTATHLPRRVLQPLTPRYPAELVQAVVDRLVAAGRLLASGALLAVPGVSPSLTEAQARWLAQIETIYRDAGCSPPALPDLAQTLNVPLQSVSQLVQLAANRGALVPINAELYLHRDHLESIKRRVAERLAAAGTEGLTVAQIRDLLGTTRKYAVPLCEYFDRIGLTRRVGDVRLMGRLIGRTP